MMEKFDDALIYIIRQSFDGAENVYKIELTSDISLAKCGPSVVIVVKGVFGQTLRLLNVVYLCCILFCVSACWALHIERYL